MNITIATRNAHKVGEIAAILPESYTVRSLVDVDNAPDIEENGESFEANAALKSVGISALISGYVLSDDSGLCVDALGGAPGIHSARYAGEHGNDAANNAHLLKELAALAKEGEDRFSARFVCVLSLAKDGVEILHVRGEVEGHIALHSSGTGGFGYDPLFIPLGYEESFAQLPAQTKNAISHRSRALAALRELLPTLT